MPNVQMPIAQNFDIRSNVQPEAKAPIVAQHTTQNPQLPPNHHLLTDGTQLTSLLRHHIFVLASVFIAVFSFIFAIFSVWLYVLLFVEEPGNNGVNHEDSDNRKKTNADFLSNITSNITSLVTSAVSGKKNTNRDNKKRRRNRRETPTNVLSNVTL